MKYNPDIRKRKSLRLKEYDYSGQGMYFVTICVKNRECLFGNIANNKIILSVPGKIAHDCLTEITTHFRDIMLDNYVIMPNHVHAIIMIKTGNDQHRRGLINQTPTNQTPTNQTPTNQTPTNQTPTNQTPTSQIPTSQIPVATQWIMMKNPNQTLGKIIRYFKGKSSRIIRTGGINYFQWQRNYYERIIRNEKEFMNIREYIRNNPLHWEMDEENPGNL